MKKYNHFAATLFAGLVFSFLFLLNRSIIIASNFTVSDATELSSALSACEGNGESDTIFLNPGSYLLTSSLGFYSEENYSITLIGDSPGTTVIEAAGRHGLYIQTTAADADITIKNIGFENGSADYGGGCQGETASADFLVQNCTFDNNTASEAGGGLSIYTFDGTVTVQDCSFDNNISSGNDAGGLFIGSDGGTMRVYNCTFMNNTAMGDDAGGCMLYSDNAGTAILSNSVFENNMAADDAGGAMIYLLGTGSQATATQNSFSNNVATLGGGGFWLRMPAGGNVEYSENQHTSNTTETANGAGAYFEMNAGKLNIQNNTFSGNQAANDGGGVWIEHFSDTVKVHHNTFSGNNASNNGGGLQVYTDRGHVEVYRNTFEGNNSSVIGGAVSAATSTGSFRINNNTCYSNNSDDGSSFYFYLEDPSSSADVYNNILWITSAGNPISYSGGQTVTATYCDIEGGEGFDWFGTGCFDADPLFADPDNGDFRLTWANYPVNDNTKSPCIDTGDPASEPDPDGSVSDVGAFYFDPSLGTAEQNITEYYFPEIYPNPVQQGNTVSIGFNRSLTGNLKVTILNVSGEEVFNNELNGNGGKYLLRVPELPKGVYFIKITSGNENQTAVKKLVIN